MIGWLVIALGLAWAGWAHVGYPLAAALLARLSPRPVRRGAVHPPLTVVIAVHNGEAELARKLENTLALDYPGPREVIVASDGSTDGTDAVAARFAERGVRLVRLPERRGKEAAQALAIAHAAGDVLAFTDVSAVLEPDCLREIVAPLADPAVACVSSEDLVDSRGGEGAYVRSEMWLRRNESRAGSIVGLSGSCFAARRELCDPWPEDLASDFRTALEAGRRGLRAVAEPSARARFRAVDDPGREWARKVRTVRRGLAVLSAYRDLLHPRHGQLAFALWGHKVARFTAPWALVAVLVASAALAPASPAAAALLAAQVLGYGLGGLTLAWPALEAFFPARLAAFFVLVNASILVAWGHHLRGERAVTWQPTAR